MSNDISSHDALVGLGASTAEAVARVLEMFAPGTIERGAVSAGTGEAAFAAIDFGGVTASVSYVNGVTGANVFVMTVACARALATAMGAGEAAEGELTELELSAVGEAANQMLAAAAAATSVVIGHDIEISPPEVTAFANPGAVGDGFPAAPLSCTTSFTIAGETCRFVQLIPNAFVLRMVRAIDEAAEQPAPLEAATDAGPQAGGPVSLDDALRDVDLRVWAELGRTDTTLGAAIELPIGSVVDLDRGADAPVDLYVNGLCFGQGRLLVTDDGEWAIEVQSVTRPTPGKRATASAVLPAPTP